MPRTDESTRAVFTASGRRELWLIALLTCLAFAARLAGTEGRSMWLDEGFTLLRLYHSLAELFGNVVILQGINTTDIHPPLYFALVKSVMLLAGDNDFALRFPSAVAGAMVVPLTFALARNLFGRNAGVLAAVLALIGPAYQWHSWEVRMYTIAPAQAALSTYLLARAGLGKSVRARPLAAWLAVTLVSVFTHYTLVSLAVGHLAFVVFVVFPRLRALRPRQIVLSAALLAILAALLLTVPAVGGTVGQVVSLAAASVAAPSRELVSAWTIADDLMGASVFGMNAADPTDGWLEGAVAGLIVVLLLLPVRRKWRGMRVLLGLSIATPIVFWTLLSYFIPNRPSFRYVIVAVPIMHALLARVAALPWTNAMLRRGVGSVLAACVLALHGFGFAQSFVRTPTWQDDWLSMTTYLRQHARPGDVLMINLYSPEMVLRRYLRDVPIQIALLREWVHTAPVPELQSRLRSAYSRVWHANTGGDGGLLSAETREILAAFPRRARVEFASRTNILQLDLYTLEPAVDAALPSNAVPIRSPAPIGATRLEAYRMEPSGPYAGRGQFELRLFWRRGAAPDAAHAVTVRLRGRLSVDEPSATWLDWLLPAELDRLPESCAPGSLCTVDYIVPIPVGLPVQTYELELAVRGGERGEVLQREVRPLSDDELRCCVRLSAPLPRRAPLLDATGVRLLEAEFQADARPGEILPVALLWQAAPGARTPWETHIQFEPLVGADVLARSAKSAGTPDFGPDRWPEGEPARDLHALRVPYSAVPGWYRLTLTRVRSGLPVDSTLLGLVRINDFPASTGSPTIGARLTGARAGELSLLGYSQSALPTRAAPFEIVTHWRVDARPVADGVLFVHVVGPDGTLVAQDDSPPEKGRRSTLTYRAGDAFDIAHRINLPAQAPGGTYSVLAGVYTRSDVARWPAAQGGVPAKDDLMTLGTFTLPPLPSLSRSSLLPIVIVGAPATLSPAAPPAAYPTPQP